MSNILVMLDDLRAAFSQNNFNSVDNVLCNWISTVHLYDIYYDVRKILYSTNDQSKITYKDVPNFNKKVEELFRRELQKTEVNYELNRILKEFLSISLVNLPNDVLITLLEQMENDKYFYHYLPDIIKIILKLEVNYRQNEYINLIKKLKTRHSSSGRYWIKKITDLYQNDNFDLSSLCEVLSTCTPSIKCYLLGIKNIEEKYIVAGLKALSKLKTGRRISIELDNNLLFSLPPVGRLSALKNIISYYSYRVGRIYKPDEQLCGEISKFMQLDIDSFLFPCSIKRPHDTEYVKKAFNRMKELINNLEKQ